MAPPKKTVKMDLNSFLNDDTFTSSWSEDDVDLNNIRIPIENTSANTIPLEELMAERKAANAGGNSFNQGGRTGGHLDPALGGSGNGMRRAHEEYPVPNEPPYRAIINNIPWDISPEGVKAWVEDGLAKPDSVEDVDLPVNVSDPTRLKGLAFITLKEREDLVQALTFNATKLNDRTVYVSVAAPRRGGFRSGGGDFDWGAARGSNYEASGPGREEPNLDWGAARGSNFQSSRPPRERREEPNLDWDSARGSNFQNSRPPREPREPRDEPELNWDSARGSHFKSHGPPREPREEANLNWDAARGSNFKAQREPREPREPREEPNLDWNAARGSNFKAPRVQRERTNEPELDWGAARGSKFQDINNKTNNNRRRNQTQEEKPVEEKNKIQKSTYDVLRDDDKDDEEEEQKAQPTEQTTTNDVNETAQNVADLSVEDNNNDEWEVVGKK
ncbi:similar to Saccharomyces cerevisiae YPR163C TIF3 Translation initiation factor eIF-4B, has RNA annealing activity [Maudiozyma barnettii]|uniref:Similar to Saccharomyces cerevisiae YPR163C TIF3 Translation initiation factor eIF-4B, has RNA annealing activity n=1 Tax=Maudiozyma barnettii TaxID=61262 RepID=A0A8H2ZJ38_9SACH|nr:Tif3p [Kazachstania barnettii]CAB4255603.1 similar to Saccharomyces cerevisiae YPR163C TIF3 Translation initiation factor eIF-4B, has RNA annealing activity [Kazachstania barnettii]CAD1784164.1 similar to Saccharomyces cerevisiae YPR163C TIF3 Translation initiation factor eIF-4B, has RNA annealing activity [Kazachstania barnettii]